MRFPPGFRPVSGLGGENLKEYRQISSLANVLNWNEKMLMNASKNKLHLDDRKVELKVHGEKKCRYEFLTFVYFGAAAVKGLLPQIPFPFPFPFLSSTRPLNVFCY